MVHARILDEFLRSSAWKPDTLKAEGYTNGGFKPAERDEEWDKLIERINKQITHLTDKRGGLDRLKSTDHDRLHRLLKADLCCFVSALTPEYRAAWDERDARNKLDFGP